MGSLSIWGIWRIRKGRETHWLSGWQKKLLSPHGWTVGLIVLTIGWLTMGYLGWSFALQDFHLLAPPQTVPTASRSSLILQAFLQNNSAWMKSFGPLLLLASGLCLQTMLFMSVWRFGLAKIRSYLQREGMAAILLIFGIFLIIWGALGGLNIRLNSDQIGWNTLGVPVLDTHFGLILILGFLILLISQICKKYLPALKNTAIPWGDILIVVCLWALAAGYWNSLELTASWYLADKSFAPNYEFYPNSDAWLYDTTSQNMVVGAGLQSLPFEGIKTRRPAYTFFLGVLHQLLGSEGQNYETLMLIQSVMLGIFPALVYLIGRRLHSRLAGLLAALLIILREGTAIQLADVITVSHTRLMMVDIPTATGIAALVLLFLYWLPAPEKQKHLVVAIGGLWGILLMVRTETMIFLPLLGLAALSALKNQRRLWLQQISTIVIMMFLVIAPWSFNNWRETGNFFLETPSNRVNFIMNRLKANSPGTGTRTQTARREERISASTYLNIILAHNLHSQVQSFLILPNIYRLPDTLVAAGFHRDLNTLQADCCSPENYVRRLGYWKWGPNDLTLAEQAMTPILLNLFIFAAGIVAVYKRRSWYGMLPLGMVLLFYFGNSLGRISGGRYLLPVDWIVILFFGIGTTQAILWSYQWVTSQPIASFWVRGSVEIQPRLAPNNTYKTGALLIGAACIGYGLLIPAWVNATPPRYTAQTLAATQAELLMAASSLPPELTEDLLALANSEYGYLIEGRALYPRYFAKNVGLQGPAFLEPRAYDRITFQLVGPTPSGVILPFNVDPKLPFPNSTDVLVIGCRVVALPQYIQAYLIYIPANDKILLSDGPLPENNACAKDFDFSDIPYD